ncbi:hypothetical protein EFL26_00065 [Nocardioides pocheonensis]|uniref:Uncharacterized protein n=1 Tax=Nocardioides pocheonensis TaxID=661485 RepID=A0A3N0GZT5_9ACTN|nr:hypothetical protein EFL26_00065 [Nocardioides pocheonensis]
MRFTWRIRGTADSIRCQSPLKQPDPLLSATFDASRAVLRVTHRGTPAGAGWSSTSTARADAPGRAVAPG